MWDNLVKVEHFQRETYRKHFLNSVHCELAISGIALSVLLAAEDSFTDSFKQLGFSHASRLFRGQYIFSPGDSQEASLKQQNTETIGFRFFSQNPLREINITAQNFVISDHSYDGYESFSERLKSYVDTASELLKMELEVNKVGLRKINSIIIENVLSYPDAYAAFNPFLFGSLRAGLARVDALKVSEEVLVLEKEGKICVLRNGLKALDYPNAYEATLDFDLVDKGEYSVEQVVSDILPILNELHFDLFRWAISDDLLQKMKGVV